MREPHAEGVANHSDPESCGGVREDVAEALTGAHAGRVLSREISFVRGAEVLQRYRRPHRGHRHRKALTDPARSQTPRTRGIFLRENREIPRLLVARATGRIGKAEAVRR